MASIKRDDVKQKWETDTEFPLVCETCLGDNPYVRMTREDHGKKCQICENPFTVFAWQAGTKGRLKRVEICRGCAQAKNVCQVCIYDLQYGLPVKVRDRVLREAGSTGGPATAVPQSNANRAWHYAQQQRALAQGTATGVESNALAHAKLQDMARMEPRYERNLPKLCSFFAKGECDRGANCPFRHEMPRDRNDPMSKQNTKDRFYGTSDPVANKILGRKRRQEEEQQKDDGVFETARATVYMRFQGDAPYPHEMSEMNIRDQFYSFGEIVSVRVQVEKGQAFIEYTQPEAAELAIASMNRKDFLGRQIFTKWARVPKRGEEGEDLKRAAASASTSSSAPAAMTVRPLAPPGNSGKPLPKAFAAAIKPPPEVAAIAEARRQRQAVGGGPIRHGGAAAAKIASGNDSHKKPYYPSSDPSRLGTS
jgi:pre-mRNA-splicing factor RBM22/SLT11